LDIVFFFFVLVFIGVICLLFGRRGSFRTEITVLRNADVFAKLLVRAFFFVRAGLLGTSHWDGIWPVCTDAKPTGGYSTDVDVRSK
jgi:hypothetical protein